MEPEIFLPMSNYVLKYVERCSLYYSRSTSGDEHSWILLGTGNIRIYSDSDEGFFCWRMNFFGNSGQELYKSIIDNHAQLIQANTTLETNECVWTAWNMSTAVEDGSQLYFRAQFRSPTAADGFKSIFTEAKDIYQEALNQHVQNVTNVLTHGFIQRVSSALLKAGPQQTVKSSIPNSDEEVFLKDLPGAIKFEGDCSLLVAAPSDGTPSWLAPSQAASSDGTPSWLAPSQAAPSDGTKWILEETGILRVCFNSDSYRYHILFVDYYGKMHLHDVITVTEANLNEDQVVFNQKIWPNSCADSFRRRVKAHFWNTQDAVKFGSVLSKGELFHKRYWCSQQ